MTTTIQLLVKGALADLLVATMAHDLDVTNAAILNAYECTAEVHSTAANFAAVVGWYCETPMNAAPYPDGTLLFYSVKGQRP